MVHGNKGRKQSKEHIRKRIDKVTPQLLGKKHSTETRKKMRKSSPHYWKNKEFSETHKKNLSDSHKGNIPWNKGKKTGKIPWNKNKKGLQVGWHKGERKYPKGHGRRYITVDGKVWRMSHYVYCKANNLKEIKTGYCIHHIDGNHANNKIENLKLMEQGEHSKMHMKIYSKKLNPGGKNGNTIRTAPR